MKLEKILVAVVFASSLPVFAADGDLGATSTGQTDVSITIGDLVQVLVEQNISLTHSVGINSEGDAGLCIYRNGSSDVKLTLTSAYPSGTGFQMTDGSSNYLTYTVDLSGGDTVTMVGSGTVNTLAGADDSSSNCGGAGNYSHTLGVVVDSSDLDAAPAGDYADEITILVEPV
jgi:hypothetical protein